MEAIFGIVIAICMFIVAIAIAGYLFGLAIRIVCGFQPPLGTCILYVIVIGVIQAVIGAAVGLILQTLGVSNQIVPGVFSLLINLGVNPLVIGLIVKDADGTGIGYVKGLLVYLANLLISIVLALICCGIPAMLFGGFAAFSQL